MLGSEIGGLLRIGSDIALAIAEQDDRGRRVLARRDGLASASFGLSISGGRSLRGLMKPSTSMRAPGSAVSSAMTRPLPSAVPRCGSSRSIAARMSSRLLVGDCMTAAAAAIPMTPMRTWSGCSSTNDLAASRAAAMRFGATSVAFMLPDMSTARITVSIREGSVSVACGRATASSSAASPASHSSGGTRDASGRLPAVSTGARLA